MSAADHQASAQIAMTWAPRPKPPTEQERELARVSGRIADAVVRWCSQRLVTDRRFRTGELCSAVVAECGGAPDSPRRIFAALRAEGRIRATLLSRSGSLFRLDEVRG